jgi:hypothetical protein
VEDAAHVAARVAYEAASGKRVKATGRGCVAVKPPAACQFGPSCPFWLIGKCAFAHPEDEEHAAARRAFEDWKASDERNRAPCPDFAACDKWAAGTCQLYHPLGDETHAVARQEYEATHGPVAPKGRGCIPAGFKRMCDRGPHCPYNLQGTCVSGHPDDAEHRAARAVYDAWRAADPRNNAPCEWGTAEGCASVRRAVRGVRLQGRQAGMHGAGCSAAPAVSGVGVPL